MIHVQKIPKDELAGFLAGCGDTLPPGEYYVTVQHDKDCMALTTEFMPTCTCEYLDATIVEGDGPSFIDGGD